MKQFTIGIIGGGQLGRMLTYEALKKGFRVAILDPDPEAPAMQCCHYPIVGNYHEERSLIKLLDVADVITYEFENIEPELLINFQNRISIFPNPEILKISKNRNREKQFAIDYQMSPPPIFPIRLLKKQKEYLEELYKKLQNTKKEWIIKTAEGGYDGKFQFYFYPEISLDTYTEQLNLFFNSLQKEQIEIIIEEKIDFDFEFSIIACGYFHNGYQTEFFKPFLNYHSEGILRKSFAWKEIQIPDLEMIEKSIRQIMEDYRYIGLLTIEFFCVGEKIYFNELAPRPHNSGHLSIEGYNYSQFEQHIRAISNLPVHKPILRTNGGMLNLISSHQFDFHSRWIQKVLEIPDTFFHYYGKKEPKEKRKMGHITVLDEDKNNVISRIQKIEEMLGSISVK